SGGEQVRTLIPVTTANGGKLFVSGPCILLKTTSSTPTVAQQMQALRPLLNSLGLPRPQPAAMARRNERERNRVKQVNLGFETLRQHVPTGRKNKKLSKVDTLKEAVRYIKYLQQLLQEADSMSDPDLTAAISDTINILAEMSMDVSSPLPLTPASTVSTSSVPETTTAVASTNTASISAEDLLQLSAVAMDVESTMALEQLSQLSQADVKPHLSLDDIKPHLSLADNQTHLSLADSQPQKRLSPADQPSQLSLVDHPSHFLMQASPDMPLAPPACSPVDLLGLQNMEFHANPGSCGGSDGVSCPVSPSESSGASEASYEDSLGNMAGETWQDLSADIADWLCSKIDIDDPENFYLKKPVAKASCPGSCGVPARAANSSFIGRRAAARAVLQTMSCVCEKAEEKDQLRNGSYQQTPNDRATVSHKIVLSTKKEEEKERKKNTPLGNLPNLTRGRLKKPPQIGESAEPPLGVACPMHDTVSGLHKTFTSPSRFA
ncbi:hypothetical protein BaRGS_00039315, partial [Batillaria attramentaria]